jgi:phage I-like protein
MNRLKLHSKGRVALVAVANEFQTAAEDGRLWMPYGEYPHGARQIKGKGRRRIVQRWNAESARAVGERIATAVAAGDPGLPVYNGHPDVPELAGNYPDKGAVGWIVAMEIFDEGATAVVEWNDAPPKKRFRWFSPYWDGNVVSDDGSSVTMHVYDVLSVGLTNTPNIVDFRLPNEAESEIDFEEETNPERIKTVNKEKLIALLGLPGDADEAAVEAAVQAMAKRVQDAEAKLKELETAKTAKESELDTVQKEKKDVETKFANERAARVDMLTHSALADARISPADLPRWKKLLVDNFDTNAVALANERPKLKTSPVADAGRAISVANSTDRVQQITAAVEAQMAKGLTYDSAHAAVRREQPDLFKK